jgi:predicted RNA methylase
MARIGSVIRCGYYPCPLPVVHDIASRIKPISPESCMILDPCCGEGEAVNALAQAMGVPQSNVWGVELEENRAATATANLPDAHIIGPADYIATSTQYGSFSVVWCNPPFDDEAGGGNRVEHSFLTRSLSLAGSGGIIVFICPEGIVKGGYESCVVSLLERCEDLRMFEFPAEHRKFKEVCIIGKVRPNWIKLDDAYSAWRSVTSPRNQNQTWLAPARRGPRYFEKTGYTDQEFKRAIAASPLWDITASTKSQKLDRPPLPVAKGHLALLLASGMLNGVVRKDGEPPHVVRGTAQKIKLEPEVEDKVDASGKQTGTVTTIREAIKLTVRAVDHRGKIKNFE